MADVEVIAEYQAFNINPQKFEYYLHAFLVRLALIYCRRPKVVKIINLKNGLLRL
ncbi:hypothetical protein [Acinetobacter baumannii]|uniref:hypothetical protein n=1 Tax=Acinetobacter baumannii TaxID=470 RepID=UPI001BB46953|nr:hypothetical protein [Acinetobacter baumannii]